MQAPETAYFRKVKGALSWGFFLFGVLSLGHFNDEKDNFPKNGEFKQIWFEDY